jgi:cofilin
MVFTSKDGSTRRPIIFVLWCPDQAPTKLKMIAAGTKHTFRQLLTGISYEIAATDLSELSLDHVRTPTCVALFLFSYFTAD